MGNRHGSSRRKQREGAYAYSDNRRDDYATNKNGGSISRRANQAQALNYQQYPNGYGGNQVAQSTNNHHRTTSSKIFYFIFK
jgi:hypothetical protein